VVQRLHNPAFLRRLTGKAARTDRAAAREVLAKRGRPNSEAPVRVRRERARERERRRDQPRDQARARREDARGAGEDARAEPCELPEASRDEVWTTESRDGVMRIFRNPFLFFCAVSVGR
jgi:hypothetical protein